MEKARSVRRWRTAAVRVGLLGTWSLAFTVLYSSSFRSVFTPSILKASPQRPANSQSFWTVFQFLVVLTRPSRRSRKLPVYFVSW
jgi:hypothetical protein